MKTSIIIILSITGIILLFQGFNAIEHLSSDHVSYICNNKYVYVESVEIGSSAYYAGLNLNDTLISINEKQITSKHYLYNRIFEKYSPGNILNYKIKKRNNIKYFQIELEHYFNLQNRLFIYGASLMSFFISILFLIITDNKRINSILFIIIYCASLLIVYINIPFSNQWMYIVFILLSLLFVIMLFLFSIIFNHLVSKHNKFTIISIILLSLLTIFWAINYLLWTKTLSEYYYNLTISSMRIFHIISLLMLIFIIINLFTKFITISNTPINYYTLSFIILLFLIILLYPVFFALPVLIKNKELIRFEYYFTLYGFLGLYIILFYKKGILNANKDI